MSSNACQVVWPRGAKRAEAVRQVAAGGAVTAVSCAEGLVVVVAGGDVPIPRHAWRLSWGFPRARINREIELADGWHERAAERRATENRRLGIE